MGAPGSFMVSIHSLIAVYYGLISNVSFHSCSVLKVVSILTIYSFLVPKYACLYIFLDPVEILLKLPNDSKPSGLSF